MWSCVFELWCASHAGFRIWLGYRWMWPWILKTTLRGRLVYWNPMFSLRRGDACSFLENCMGHLTNFLHGGFRSYSLNSHDKKELLKPETMILILSLKSSMRSKGHCDPPCNASNWLPISGLIWSAKVILETSHVYCIRTHTFFENTNRLVNWLIFPRTLSSCACRTSLCHLKRGVEPRCANEASDCLDV